MEQLEFDFGDDWQQQQRMDEEERQERIVELLTMVYPGIGVELAGLLGLNSAFHDRIKWLQVYEE